MVRKMFTALLFLFFMSSLMSGQVVINEFMAINATTIEDTTDPSGPQTEDWVEIYNAGSSSVNLSNYYLTDKPDRPQKWPFISGSIPAKGFILIWCDEDSGKATATGYHTNFKLSGSGEFIGLVNGTAYVDSLSFGEQQEDVSLGRSSDGGSSWVYFSVATPGKSNAGGAVTSVKDQSVAMPYGFKLNHNYPNPFNPQTSIRFELSETAQISLLIYNNLGQQIATLADQRFEAGSHTLEWDAQDLPSGIYYSVLRVGNNVQMRAMTLLK